jgi:hypothetical protein
LSNPGSSAETVDNEEEYLHSALTVATDNLPRNHRPQIRRSLLFSVQLVKKNSRKTPLQSYPEISGRFYLPLNSKNQSRMGSQNTGVL